MSKFTREARYVTLKLNKLMPYQINALNELLFDVGAESSMTDCVVVEADWPIYEQTWDAIQRLAENKPQKIEELEQQLAESQASNERLRSCLELFISSCSKLEYEGGWVSKPLCIAEDLVEETSKQSLAHIKADYLDEIIAKHSFTAYIGDFNPEVEEVCLVTDLQADINKLREDE